VDIGESVIPLNYGHSIRLRDNLKKNKLGELKYIDIKPAWRRSRVSVS